MKRVGRVVAIVFMLLISLAGFQNGANELGDATTGLQTSVQFGDMAWGIFGLLTAIGMWRRRPWALTTSIAWAVCVVYSATVASFAFSDPTFADPGTKAGVIGAMTGTTLISLLFVWAARVSSRPVDVPKATSV